MSPAAPAPSLPAATLIDPKVLMAIDSLELRARAVVEGFWSGLHRSPHHGFSVEFTEYRQYAPGDDPRYLDWRVFGRSDRYFIKKFEDETNLRCHLLVDQSRSMNYGSTGYTKAQYAATLAGTLAYFLHLQGDAVGLLTFGEHVLDYLPARHRASHLRQVLHALERPTSGRATDLAAPLTRLTELVRRRGLIVLLSDLLAPLDRLEPSLLTLTAGRHEVVVFQVLDPRELTLDFASPSLFEDLESGRTLHIDPAGSRRRYQEKLEAHLAALRRICQKLGVSYHRLTTDEPLERALFAFLQQRVRPGRPAARPGGMPA